MALPGLLPGLLIWAALPGLLMGAALPFRLRGGGEGCRWAPALGGLHFGRQGAEWCECDVEIMGQRASIDLLAVGCGIWGPRSDMGWSRRGRYADAADA